MGRGIEFDFSTPDDVKEMIKNTVEAVPNNNPYKYVVSCRVSNLEGDSYLYYVLAKGGVFDGYVLWMYNADCGGLSSGHYDMDFKSALELMANRVNFYQD